MCTKVCLSLLVVLASLLRPLAGGAGAMAPSCAADGAAPSVEPDFVAAVEAAAEGDESMLLLQLTLNIDGAGKVQVQQTQSNSESEAGVGDALAQAQMVAGLVAEERSMTGAWPATDAPAVVVTSIGAAAEVNGGPLPLAAPQTEIVAAESNADVAAQDMDAPEPQRIAVVTVPAEVAAAALGDQEASLLPEAPPHAPQAQLPWESAGMAVVGAMLIASGIVIPCFMLMLACASVSSEGGGGPGSSNSRRDGKRASYLMAAKAAAAGSFPDAGAQSPSAASRSQEEPDAEPAPLEEDSPASFEEREPMPLS